MNKNKKIISASLALALGVSLLIPNAKANEEKSVENALKEPVKTSENVKAEEKSDVVNEKITIKKAPVNENGEEKPDDETEKPDGETEKPDGETEKPDDKKENSETDEEKSKDEKKVKPKEYKMSELLNEKGAFEKCKGAELDFMGYEIWCFGLFSSK